MFTNQKKAEVVYCRFKPGIYDLVKLRAESWGVSNAEAIQRLCFIAEMSLWAAEQIIVQDGPVGQAPRRCETEELLNAFYGAVRSE